jgi:hypothetical protein
MILAKGIVWTVGLESARKNGPLEEAAHKAIHCSLVRAWLSLFPEPWFLAAHFQHVGMALEPHRSFEAVTLERPGTLTLAAGYGLYD